MGDELRGDTRAFKRLIFKRNRLKEFIRFTL